MHYIHVRSRVLHSINLPEISKNLKKNPGRYYDVILLKTDSPIKPEIQLSVYGQILESQKKTQ